MKSEAETSAEVLRCSFCNKTQDDVRKLIAGPAVFICDECVEVCVDVILDDRPAGVAPDPVEHQRRLALVAKLGRDQGVCSLCGNSALSENLLPIEARGILCGDCADAIEDALARGRPLS